MYFLYVSICIRQQGQVRKGERQFFTAVIKLPRSCYFVTLTLLPTPFLLEKSNLKEVLFHSENSIDLSYEWTISIFDLINF